MAPMLPIIIREILLFLGITVFPPVLVLFLIYMGFLPAGVVYYACEMCFGSQGLTGIIEIFLSFWVQFLPLYVMIQVIRGYLWGQRSRSGKRWAHLYFCVISALLGCWSLWEAWDLFYFMYALGDMPAELLQFIRLESFHLLTAILSLAIAAYFFLSVLDRT